MLHVYTYALVMAPWRWQALAASTSVEIDFTNSE